MKQRQRRRLLVRRVWAGRGRGMMFRRQGRMLWFPSAFRQKLQSVPVRLVMADEVDRYAAD